MEEDFEPIYESDSEDTNNLHGGPTNDELANRPDTPPRREEMEIIPHPVEFSPEQRIELRSLFTDLQTSFQRQLNEAINSRDTRSPTRKTTTDQSHA